MNRTRIEQIVRYLLAILLAVFGGDKFLHFMPRPAAPEAGGQFLGALTEAGYVFPTIGGVFLLAALLLMFNRVLFALLLIAPIAVNILGYHYAFDRAGAAAGGVLALLWILLAALHTADLGVLFRSSQSSKPKRD